MENIKKAYELAKLKYAELGIDTDKAINELANIPISMHCWQGDDIFGFENSSELSGGIQVTGNYPGRANGPVELMADIDKALSLIPGTHRINVHACYPTCDTPVERDQLKPEHFAGWVKFAKERNLGLDFNPTYFAHPKADVATLSSEDEEIRQYWVRHGIASIKIAEYFAKELGKPSLVNIWIPDGFKDIPADRTAPRARLKKSLDEILAVEYDKSKVYVAVESKVFGIGVESYTVGSHEFYMNYAAKNDILCLLDNGHYHPTEVVSDKISSMLLFSDKVALHVTRGVRWDSDHVVLFDDETREIAKEIVMNGADRVLIGLDYFDASINRIAAWVTGMRNMQKALLFALLKPNAELSKAQNERDLTKVLVMQEEIKTYPLSAVWDYFCMINNVPTGSGWYDEVVKYEKEVLIKR